VTAAFAGTTAQLYARYRRDLPADQARALAELLGLGAEDVAVDLGCGTGQLGVPLRRHCAGVVGVDPEPAMLAELRARAAPEVLCVLGADDDLPAVGRLLLRDGGVAAVVIGNALHWMDEARALSACADLVRPGGGIGVITQGPPMWLGPAPWQQELRQVLEQFFGPVASACGSDDAALEARVGVLEGLGLAAQVSTWRAGYEVDADWVIGHLGSTLPEGALRAGEPGGPDEAVRTLLDRRHGRTLVEEVTTTAIVARLPA
jgi:SAM-dependent methyltransferase